MAQTTDRRQFLSTITAAGLSTYLAPYAVAAHNSPIQRKKALIGRPDEKTLASFKAAGFDGIEARVWDISLDEAATYRKVADDLQMPIHSVLRGWTNFNSPDKAKVQSDIDSVKKALKTSQVFGADALLLVPCRLLTKVAQPKPEEFAITFDEKTGHVKEVVEGDNKPFQDYINAHNVAVDTSRRALEALIPTAEKTGVVIALENVWSDLWVKPQIFANFVRSFQSPWVQTYYDIGNHVKYAKPEEWIDALGKTIVKVHVKDFVIDRDAPRGGQFVNIRDGDVNWPSVMKCLDKIGYDGWMTIEGSGKLPMDERNERLDMILAGK